MEQNGNIDDLSAWNAGPGPFFNEKGFAKVNELKRHVLNVDAVQLYCLLKGVLGIGPNGPYTHMIRHKPIDEIIWWDFVIHRTDFGYIHVWRTSAILEVSFDVKDELFDVKAFFGRNFGSHAEKIRVSKGSLEKHLLFLNHFHSYQHVVISLSNLMESIEAVKPTFPEHPHMMKEEEAKTFSEGLQSYTKNIAKLHALRKSLILNAAFCVEAMVNNLFRVGLSVFVKNKNVREQVMGMRFKEKLRVIDFYVPFMNPPNLSEGVMIDVFRLVEMRNKYVHAEEDSTINKIGEIFFDDDFPLMPVEREPYVITNVDKTYGEPSHEKTLWAESVMNEFIDYVESLIKEDIRDSVKQVLETNPLGFNTAKGVYSRIFTDTPVHFFIPSN